MARSEDITVPAGIWTEITNADVSEITFQNKSTGGKMQVAATVGSVAPSNVRGTVYGPGAGEYALRLSEAFPGVPGANRVWVFMEYPAEVFVSHA